MRDVLYVLMTLAFFAICIGLVRACDVLLGPDEDDLTDLGPAALVVEPAAETAARVKR